jgi:DNA-nicking Smr family endonuclease
MKRRIRPEEARLWSAVASTVRALPGRRAPAPQPAEPAAEPPATLRPAPAPADARPAVRRPSAVLHGIEPNRERRIALGREEIGGRLDLHGMDQDQAHAALTAFIVSAYQQGHRAVLVITGRGRLGGGVLRRRTPDWLGEGPLRAMVAGVSRAHRRHGGEGAFYVALKRRS